MAVGFVPHSLDGLPIDTYAGEMALADLDGDGDPDLVNGIVGWHENLDGAGQFGESQPYVSPFDGQHYADDVDVADIDRDGDQDIVAAITVGTERSIIWFENRDGRGRFGPPQTIYQLPTDVQLLDLVGGSQVTFALSRMLGTQRVDLQVYRYEATTASLQLTFSDSTGADAAVLADLDGDGGLDLASDRGIAMYDVDRQEWSPIGGPAPGPYFAVGALMEDGESSVIAWNNLELIRIRPGATEAEVLPTAKSLPDLIGLPALGVDLRVRDLDGDGDGDLIFTRKYEEGQVNLVSINADGQLDTPQSLAMPFQIVGDVNGDGAAELIDRTNVWQYNTPDATVSLLFGRDEYAPRGGGVTADLDRDGDLDLVFVHGTYSAVDVKLFNAQVRWSENINGDGLFGPSELIAALPNISLLDDTVPLLLADFDLDGDLDYLQSFRKDLTSPMTWIENTDGRGTFSTDGHPIVAPNHFFSRTQIIDIDQDGDADLVSDGDWIENLAGESFAPSRALIAPTSIEDIAWVDWDVDGDLDALVLPVSDGEQQPHLQWYERLNDQPPAFAEAVDVAADEWPSVPLQQPRLQLIDIDQDGDSDLILKMPHSHYLQRNNSGQLGVIELIDGMPGEYVDVTDLDRDGDLDILVRDAGGTDWFENIDGAGHYVAGTLLSGSERIASVGDVDGDGVPDLLSDNSIWWEQRTIGDVNGDGEFNSADLVEIFAAGLYDYDVPGIASFETG
ncbi:MAG: VCBS repeat-containing protein, partial [Planctomycetales bacterium]|nr:VCBS repeat-containing protein [Planctomycetales bacterium]